MSADRRAKDTRRSEDRRAKPDRRAQDTRRKTDSRRASEGGKKAGGSPANPMQKAAATVSLMQRLLKKLAIIFALLVVIVTGVLLYFFSNLDYYMGKVSKKISFSMTRAEIDPESLTDRTTKARVFIKVKNDLPLAVSLQSIKLNAKLGGYTIAKGVQVLPVKRIKKKSEAIVAVSFHVDSIMTRRGLQRAVENNAGPSLKSFLARLQGKNQAITDNLKGILKIKGSTDFRVIAGGIEIPFSRLLQFD